MLRSSAADLLFIQSNSVYKMYLVIYRESVVEKPVFERTMQYIFGMVLLTILTKKKIEASQKMCDVKLDMKMCTSNEEPTKQRACISTTSTQVGKLNFSHLFGLGLWILTGLSLRYCQKIHSFFLLLIKIKGKLSKKDIAKKA